MFLSIQPTHTVDDLQVDTEDGEDGSPGGEGSGRLDSGPALPPFPPPPPGLDGKYILIYLITHFPQHDT